MWRFVCSGCGWRIEQEDIVKVKCPDCGAFSWLAHLLPEKESPDDMVGVAQLRLI